MSQHFPKMWAWHFWADGSGRHKKFFASMSLETVDQSFQASFCLAHKGFHLVRIL